MELTGFIKRAVGLAGVSHPTARRLQVIGSYWERSQLPPFSAESLRSKCSTLSYRSALMPLRSAGVPGLSQGPAAFSLMGRPLSAPTVRPTAVRSRFGQKARPHEGDVVLLGGLAPGLHQRLDVVCGHVTQPIRATANQKDRAGMAILPGRCSAQAASQASATCPSGSPSGPSAVDD